MFSWKGIYKASKFTKKQVVTNHSKKCEKFAYTLWWYEFSFDFFHALGYKKEALKHHKLYLNFLLFNTKKNHAHKYGQYSQFCKVKLLKLVLKFIQTNFYFQKINEAVDLHQGTKLRA